MPLVGVGRGAGGLQRTVDAVGRLADDLELVDRIGRGGRVEFHGSAPSLRPARRPSVRSTSFTLNAFSCGRLRAGEQLRRDRLRTARQLGFGRFDAPRLVRDAAQGDAARAVALDDRGDRDQREGIGGAVANLVVDVLAADRLAAA